MLTHPLRRAGFGTGSARSRSRLGWGHAGAWPALEAAIRRLSPAIDLEDHDQRAVVVHVVDDTERPDPDAPGLPLPADLEGAWRPRSLAKGPDGARKPLQSLTRELPEVSLGGRSQLDAVGQG